jgi:hypothetical protein
MADQKPTIPEKYFEDVAGRVFAKREEYIKERAGIETQWLKNLRQYRGIYDPDIKAKIPADRSSAYPRDTRKKIKAFVAKMMEMMFPATDKNWELKLTPIPSIPQEALQSIIDGLKAEEEVKALEEGREVLPVSSDDIERAVRAFADVRRGNMETLIHDQLMDKDVDWPGIAKRAVRSGSIYGAGFVKSPLVRTQKERVWEEKGSTYVAKTVTERRPYPEFIKVWDIYPDLTAPTWDEQDGLFERMVFSREGFRRLADRPGFRKDTIKKYLMDNQTGNYKYRTFEQLLREMNHNTSDNDKPQRRYEVFRFFGFWSVHDLEKVGLEFKESQRGDNVLSDIWIIDNQIIFIDTAPFGLRPSDVYHAYIYAEDEEAGLTGVGMPEELRDRQMSICAGTRALYDNMAITAGPMFEVAVDLLKPGSDLSVRAFKVWEREGEGTELQHDIIKNVDANNHTTEIMSILDGERRQFDEESNMPGFLTGNTEGLGEAFRTSSNMSQLSGGANMVTKDHVRAFDKLTASVTNSFLQWNMDFSDKEDIRGDYQVNAMGNISLVAKEVRGLALDQFASTLTERERVRIDDHKSLTERMKARDLPADILLPQEDGDAAVARFDARLDAAAQAEAALTQAKTGKLQADSQRTMVNAQKDMVMTESELKEAQARVAEALARIETMRADVKDKEQRRQLDSMTLMFETLLADLEASSVGADSTAAGAPTTGVTDKAAPTSG